MTWRRAAAAVVIALAAWVAWTFVLVPIRCHRLKGRLLRPSYEAQAAGDSTARTVAASYLQELETCLAPACRDIELLFLLAINHRTLGRNQVALDLYRQALAMDRRPEIYANIADTHVALGNHEEAFQNYVIAGTFFTGYLLLIDDEAMRARVRAAILAARPDLEPSIRRAEQFQGWGRFR